MQAKDIIKAIRTKKNFSFYTIDRALKKNDGYTRQGEQRPSVGLNKAVNILTALNCSLIVKDNDTGELYTIEPNKADD